MSKIKIVGHASGSGILTIAAPNTDTDRTITIPDVTGTLLDSGSDLPAANLTGTVADARISALTASKLTGALPAISAANLTAIPAANITGTLPAISGANLTGVRDTTGGRKNLFINGGFDVWQRGTSLAGATSYLADRWFNGTTETQSRQTFTVGQTDVSHNPTYYHRGSSGSTEWYGIKQKVENVGITASREVTLSYWAKGSSAFTNAPFRGQYFGSGGSSAVSAALSTASITTSWARYTHTFTLPSISGKTVGDGSYMQINLIRANVNNITIDLANCQLEFGSVATDFEHRSYGEELALCQRYYYNISNNSSDSSIMNGNYYSSTAFYGHINFPVSMRSPSSITLVVSTGADYFKIHSNGTVQTFDGTGLTIYRRHENGATLYTSSLASSTQGTGGWFMFTNASAKLAFSCEL